MEVGHRMAGIWRMHRHWRAHGPRYLAHQDVVYLHFLSDARVAYHYIHDTRLLDEHEALYVDGQEESVAVAVGEVDRLTS